PPHRAGSPARSSPPACPRGTRARPGSHGSPPAPTGTASAPGSRGTAPASRTRARPGAGGESRGDTSSTLLLGTRLRLFPVPLAQHQLPEQVLDVHARLID